MINKLKDIQTKINILKHPFRIIVGIFLIFISTGPYAQTIETVLSVPWNTDDGIKTKVGLDNYCAMDFAIINDSTFSILCVVEGKVKSYSTISKRCIHEFSYNHRAEYLAYDSITNRFYIANSSSVFEYSHDGDLLSENHLGQENMQYILDLKAENGDLTIIGEEFTSYKLVENGVINDDNQLRLSKRKASLLNDKMYVYPINWRDSEENRRIILYNDTMIIDTINIGINSESYLGIVENNLVVVKYNINHEQKIPTLMQLLFISLDDYKIKSTIDIPQINHCYQNTDFRVNNNNIYQLLTAQDSLYVVRISIPHTMQNLSDSSGIKYPEKFNYKYNWYHGLIE